MLVSGSTEGAAGELELLEDAAHLLQDGGWSQEVGTADEDEPQVAQTTEAAFISYAVHHGAATRASGGRAKTPRRRQRCWKRVTENVGWK